VNLEVARAATRRDRDENRAFAVTDLACAHGSREFGFAFADPGLKIEVNLGRMSRREELDAVLTLRGQRRDMGERRQPVVADADRHHDVEAEQEQVGPVIPRDAFLGEVGVQTAETAESAPTGSEAPPVRQFGRVGVAHHHVLDRASTVDQDSDLPPGVMADLGQLPRELMREELVGRHASPEQTFELANLAGSEAAGVTKDLDRRLLLTTLLAGLGGEAAIDRPCLIELREDMVALFLGAPPRPGVGHLLQGVDPA